MAHPNLTKTLGWYILHAFADTPIIALFYRPDEADKYTGGILPNIYMFAFIALYCLPVSQITCILFVLIPVSDSTFPSASCHPILESLSIMSGASRKQGLLEMCIFTSIIYIMVRVNFGAKVKLIYRIIYETH